MTEKPASRNRAFSLTKYFNDRAKRVEKTLETVLPKRGAGHPGLRDAMRYGLLGSGKRFRPILTLASCEACEGDWKSILEPACAVEFVHAYSLIHDDLPAMDDAALRRGKPSLHRKYGEAMAILAGDALLTEAWNLIARWGANRPGGSRAAAKMIAELTRGAGIEGMVSGQAFDIDPKGTKNVAALDALHALKTGALITASVRMGAIAAGADKRSLDKLTWYARAVGLAFQVADDVLDVTGSDTGKDPGADASKGKRTYPAMVGIGGARKKARELVEEAESCLKGLKGDTEPLAAIARYAIEREK